MTQQKIIEHHIRDTWSKASTTINNHWAIDNYTYNNNKYYANGIFYSPAGDTARPYPVFYLNFILEWDFDDRFTIIFAFKPKNYGSSMLKNDNIFEYKNEKLYFRLNRNIKQKEDVSAFLDAEYEILFTKEPNCLASNITYWLAAIKEIYKSYIRS